MKHLRPLLAVSALAGFTVAAFADNPTGTWKIVSAANGQVTSTGRRILKLSLKDGQLTGSVIDIGWGGYEDEQNISGATFKNDTISFDFTKNGSGFAGAVYEDPLHPNKAGSFTFSGRVMGDTLVGTAKYHAMNRPLALSSNAGKGIRIADMNIPDTDIWVASRITPRGIWDVTMSTLATDADAHEWHPLRTLTRQPMQFEFKDGQLTGTWLAPARDGNLRPVPVEKAVLDADGFSFTVVDGESPGGKIVYDFDGSFASNPDVTPHQSTVGITANGLTVATNESLLQFITGSLKITGPDEKIYKSSWKAIRWKPHADDKIRTDVDVGTPYEVRNPQKPKP